MIRRSLFTILVSLLASCPLARAQRVSGPQVYFDTEADRRMARAVASGDVHAVRQMIGRGEVSPLAVGRDATSWLVIAVAARQRGTLDALLKLGALGDPRGKIAGQALYAATLLDDLSWLRRLHAAGADLNNYGGGDLLLEVAIDTRNEATLRFYLANGADIEMRTTVGGTVVLSAAAARRFDMANQLLDRGASPWAMDALGSTLGHTAEKAARVPAWDTRSEMEKERARLLRRLHAIGFPDPAPRPDEALALRRSGRWPPAGETVTPATAPARSPQAPER